MSLAALVTIGRPADTAPYQAETSSVDAIRYAFVDPVAKKCLDLLAALTVDRSSVVSVGCHTVLVNFVIDIVVALHLRFCVQVKWSNCPTGIWTCF